MMFFSLLQYSCVFVLGLLVSLLLSGAVTRPNYIQKSIVISVVLLSAQLATFLLFGIDITKKCYPLIVHIPMWVFLVILFSTPKLQTLVSILLAYMCCQPPRWIASAGLLIPESHWLYQILYLPVAAAFLFFVWRYLVAPIRHFMERSRKACVLIGILPGIYYVFDYVTTVHTRLLTSGNMAAVQFVPSVLSVVYLMFIVMYHSEMETQYQLRRERDFLESQLNRAKDSFASIQQLQRKTQQYRHDMRHHFNLLKSLAMDNNISQIQQYLQTVQKDIEDITPVRYCNNDVVNILLSYYASNAKEKQVEISITASLPNKLIYRDTELCSLLSNGLENAITAASRISDPQQRKVSIHLGTHGENILIQIENTYSGNLIWKDGLPCTQQKGHGLGTQSIRAIARSHGGEATFRTRNDLFQLRIILPNLPEM